jgi:hypothetical protein
MESEARMQKLAQRIGALAQKDEQLLQYSRQIGDLRIAAAREIHGICAGFVSAINQLLPGRDLSIDPSEFREELFDEDVPYLIQLGVRGRVLQIQFQATEDLESTEDFRVPYILEGTIRAFNQDLLDRSKIEEQLLFFTLERPNNQWRYFDPPTHRSAAFDRDYIVSLMEQLI